VWLLSVCDISILWSSDEGGGGYVCVLDQQVYVVQGGIGRSLQVSGRGECGFYRYFKARGRECCRHLHMKF
jgi:hypothetical protein